MQTERINLRATADSTVVKNIKLKRDLLADNSCEHKQIKTALLCGDGIMWGAFGIGVLAGMEKSDLTDTFDCAIGVSAGAANLAYFLACQSELGASIYFEDLPENKFIDFKRFKKMADIDLLEEVFRGERGSKRLDVDRVKSSRTKLFVSVTNTITGEGELIDIQDPNIDVVTALKASSAMPVAYNRTVTINGQEYSDGASGLPLPINYAINELGCNNILIILHRPYGFVINRRTEIIENILSRVYMGHTNPLLRAAFLSRHKKYAKILRNLWDYSNQTGVNIGVISLEDSSISRFSMDKEKLKNLATYGTQQALRVFS